VSVPPIGTVPAEAGPSTELTVDLSADDDTEGASHFRRAIPLVLGLSAVLVVAMFGLGLLDGQEAPTVAPTTTPSTTEMLAAPVTEPPSTTANPTTTTAPAPTTTVPATTIPPPSAVGVWGEPVALSRLTLKANAIGPIAVGSRASEAIGRLVASLGTPEEIGAAGTDFGLCAGDDGRFVRWAELVAIVSGTLTDGTFVGYRYEEPAVPTSHIDLATPSGVHLGDDLATVNETYAKYSIAYESANGSSTFRLSDGEELLLWGPISSTEESGRVLGIFSPPACSTG
jgi:hypothetical protein